MFVLRLMTDLMAWKPEMRCSAEDGLTIKVELAVPYRAFVPSEQQRKRMICERLSKLNGRMSVHEMAA